VHVCVARFPGSPLSLRFGRVGRSQLSIFDTGSFTRGRPCKIIRVGRLRASM